LSKVPELGELVIGRITSVKDYGAYVAVDEYPGYEGFVHVSEISLKWVRNIRDILREGQRNVFKIIRVNPETLQIDLSIKKVSQREKVEKLLEVKKKSKVVRVMELFEKEAGKNAVQKVYAMESDPLKLYDLFEKFAGGVGVSEVLAGLTAQEAEVLQRLVTQEIKRREFVVKADIVLRCEDARGVEAIREAALAAEAAAGVGEVVEVKTKGSPTYMLAVKASTRERASELYETALNRLSEVMRRYKGICEPIVKEKQRPRHVQS